MSAVLTRRAALQGSTSAALGLGAIMAGIAPTRAAAIDDDLIEFSRRVERLCQRCDALADRRAAIDDRATTILGFGPKAPPQPPIRQTIVDQSTATDRVLIISCPKGRDPAWDEWERVKTADRAAYERDCEALQARLGLPEVEKRFDRSHARLRRWIWQLADLHPRSTVGLAAKASALVAVGKRVDGDLDEMESRLALSIAADAVRLHRTSPNITGDARHA